LEIALVKVKADVSDDELLSLFDRIGRGGSPLTDDERLYSIYKHREPRVHNTVNAIFQDQHVGRVLPPTKIAASAIRIAFASSHTEPHEGNYLPDVRSFAREMAPADETTVKVSARVKRKCTIRKELEKLLPTQGDLMGGALPSAFRAIFSVISHRGPYDDIGLPRIMLSTLSANLVQVLLLWAILAREIDTNAITNSRTDLIRFVLFWRLCVSNEDKASVRCFHAIRKSTGHVVPIKVLHDMLVGDPEEIAIPLVQPATMESFLVPIERPIVWRTAQDRFAGPDRKLADLAKRWWEARGQNMLPWLQRAYLQQVFADFDPTSGRDDDTPYDIDHMVPHSDWGIYWTPVYAALRLNEELDEKDLLRMWRTRSDIGNGIGNKWLVDFSLNRGWGNRAFASKLELLEANEPPKKPSDKCAAALLLRAFDTRDDARQDWSVASGIANLNWPMARVKTFEMAIERRAAWLYKMFYDGLEFSEWKD